MSDIFAAPQPQTRYLAEIAKSGRSTCKKCKAKIEDRTLRIGSAFDNGERLMTSWYHPACWPVPKALKSLDELENWQQLSDEHKAIVVARAPNRAPTAIGASSATADAGSACSTIASSVTTPAVPAIAASTSASATVAFNSFSAFVALTERLEAEGSSGEKAAIINRRTPALRRHLARLASSVL